MRRSGGALTIDTAGSPFVVHPRIRTGNLPEKEDLDNGQDGKTTKPAHG
jgi:hypothetical protein